jgi:hypothetical protein
MLVAQVSFAEEKMIRLLIEVCFVPDRVVGCWGSERRINK